MKPETDPIGDDEWLVWEDRFVERQPPIAGGAFEPRDGRHPDVDGLSLFREACLEDATQSLLVLAEDKRHRHGIVKIPVMVFHELGLSVQRKVIPEVPGHVVIPEMNIVAFKANRAAFVPWKSRLSEVASLNIVLRPRMSAP